MSDKADAFASMTDEEIEAAVIEELGKTALGLMAAASRAGHITLRGHLVYHHENSQMVGGAFITWLRIMTAWGAEARNDMNFPTELVAFAEKWYLKDIQNRLKVQAHVG